MNSFYTGSQSESVFSITWQDDIPTPVFTGSSQSCEEFAAMLEVTVDQLWAV